MASGIVIGNQNVLNKIQSFLNDTAYRDAIKNSATFNTRLSIERRLRLPFLDSQTGVAQNHSNLFMTPRQRIPGLQEGQIYTYPSKRWRKKRRQYLLTFMQPRRKEVEAEVDLHTISTVENPAAVNEDSKDSGNLKDETTRLKHVARVPAQFVQPMPSVSHPSNFYDYKDSWFYDDLDIPDAGEFDDPDPDSDFDYEEMYSKRKKKRMPKMPRQGPATTGRKKTGGGTPGTPRGRKKVPINYDPAADIDKPFSCELCGARYKTRPGLTYHYTHSHKDQDNEEEEGKNLSPKASRENSNSSTGENSMTGMSRRGRQPGISPQPPPPLPSIAAAASAVLAAAAPPPSTSAVQPPVSQVPIPVTPASEETVVTEPSAELPETDKANPSPYCDFCLGDASQNKKTGESEELVSCSDCGRSGHPSCLLFTANMIVSVRKYRWQCIECKCCSICGTSDNDDQLLFCDDCDRGYHMYCLSPPLTTPPEGTWSCSPCLAEFHK